jgi:hypothetical protein
MWAAILLFGILLPILSLGAGAAFLWAAIVLLRRRSVDIRISFSGIVFAYLALMMLIGVFVTASGAGMVGKVALVQVTSNDFGYNPKTTYAGFDKPRTSTPLTTSEASDKKEEDTILGGVLALVGLLMLVPHAVAAVTLRVRKAHGSDPVFRGYNLLALATATIGFLAAGGTTLGTALQRVSDDRPGWEGHAIAEPLAFAIVLFPVACWFGYRLWAQVAADITTAPQTPEAAEADPA